MYMNMADITVVIIITAFLVKEQKTYSNRNQRHRWESEGRATLGRKGKNGHPGPRVKF